MAKKFNLESSSAFELAEHVMNQQATEKGVTEPLCLSNKSVRHQRKELVKFFNGIGIKKAKRLYKLNSLVNEIPEEIFSERAA